MHREKSCLVQKMRDSGVYDFKIHQVEDGSQGTIREGLNTPLLPSIRAWGRMGVSTVEE